MGRWPKVHKGWKADVALAANFADSREMETRKNATRLPFWLAYLRAALGFFLVLVAIDWLAFAATGNWLSWPFLIPIALIAPAAMTAIT